MQLPRSASVAIESSSSAAREGLVARLTHNVRAGGRPSLCVAEVRNFEYLRATYGHRFADWVVAAVGGALNSLRNSDEAVVPFDHARFLIELDSDTPAVAFAVRTLARFEMPVKLPERDVLVDVATGLAVTESDTDDGDDLIDTALAGLREANRTSAGYVVGRTPATSAQCSEATDIALRAAIESDALEVHYQPLVATRDGLAQGAEALVRMRDAAGHLIPPDRFIPLAEATGLVGPLDEAVLRRAARDWRQRFGADGGGHTLSVNVSARRLGDPWLSDAVLAILDEAGLQPGALKLEITERSILEAFEQAATTMARLDSAGVSFALDDFGTGYSSLSVLAELPFHTVKLDRSLISDLPSSARRQAVVRGIAGMANDLGIQVLAEGVETPEQLVSVRDLGCDLAQGYLFGRPGRQVDFKPGKKLEAA